MQRIFKKIFSLAFAALLTVGAATTFACAKTNKESEEEIDVTNKVITNCDSIAANEVFGLYLGKDITWVESFTDSEGTTKNGCLKLAFDGNAGADVVTLTIPEKVAARMKKAKFDYFELTFCVDNIDAYNGQYGGYSLYSANLSIPDYNTNPLACKKWHTIKIQLSELARTDYVTYCFQDEPSETMDDFRVFVVDKYTTGGYLFNLSSWFAGQTVQFYIDSMTWGVNETSAN